jgi:DNA repair protein RadC
MSQSTDLHVVTRDGVHRPATPDEVLEEARRVLSHRIRRGVTLDSPSATRQYLALKLGGREHEVFTVLMLDNRHRLIECLELFRGTIDGASVHPREVVKEALKHNAAAVILAHNHPSGVAEPSQADELITRRLREALAIVDIRVLDHLLGGSRSVTVETKWRECQENLAPLLQNPEGDSLVGFVGASHSRRQLRSSS